MKVALIDPSLFTWPYDERLRQGLEGLGHRVDLFGKRLAPAEVGAGPLRQHFYGGLGAAERWPRPARLASKGLSHLMSMRRLVAVLARERPEVIHFQWLPLPLVDRGFLGALRRIAPLVFTAHDSQPFNADPRAWAQSLGATAVLRRFDRVITHTELGRRRLAGYGVPADRIVRIAHGILDGLPAAGERPAGPSTVIEFLLFGKVKPYKGVDLALDALAQLPAAMRQRCRLRVVGKPYMDVRPLAAQVEALGLADIVQLDFRFVPDAEMAALLAAADVLLFPYREIDVSGVLMASLAIGRPIVASAIGGFAEMLEDGVSALLVPPGDAGLLAAAMSRMIGEPGLRAALTTGLDRLAGAIPGWPEIARQTAAVYAAARGGAGRPCQVSSTANSTWNSGVSR